MTTPTTIYIKSEELLADIRSAAWLEQELHPELDRHRRHQMADICEKDNVEAVWRVLATAVAEVRFALLRIIAPEGTVSLTDTLEHPSRWEFRLRFRLPPDTLTFLKEKIHGYLVAAVMADRAGVIIPACSHIWSERASTALSQLRQAAGSARSPRGPVRRPVWPM